MGNSGTTTRESEKNLLAQQRIMASANRSMAILEKTWFQRFGRYPLLTRSGYGTPGKISFVYLNRSKGVVPGIETLENRTENLFVDNLSKSLENYQSSDKARILHGIYKQLVPSHKGRVTNGPYRSLAENNDPHIFGLAFFVANQMEQYSYLQNQARRLRQYYHL